MNQWAEIVKAMGVDVIGPTTPKKCASKKEKPEHKAWGETMFNKGQTRQEEFKRNNHGCSSSQDSHVVLQ